MMRGLWVLLAVWCLVAPVVAPCAPRAVVLGVDGFDPVLVRQLMAQGLLPNIARLVARGGMASLGTANPPQSPVAWSNFITGMDPGGHGLFDFVAMDRDTLLPYLSSSRVAPAARQPLALGKWRVPLGADTPLLLRDGTAFWEVLEQAGVATTLFQVPANYPPVPSGEALAGMGTPDLRGTPGTFTYYTDAPQTRSGEVSGGLIRRVARRGGVVAARLEGPPNAFRADGAYAAVDFQVYVDAEHPVAMIDLDGQEVMLAVGEWSDWVAVDFRLLPGLVSVPGMVRFYLKSTAPHFALFASPVNIDPRRPAQTLSHPPDYARRLADSVGPFYTQEMPESSKALQNHVLTPQEYLAQSSLVLDERRRLLEHELARFHAADGPRLLFFYIGTVDQRHHMLYREADPGHLNHAADTPPDLVSAMQDTYVEIDHLVGRVAQDLDDDTLFLVMSDHGFAPFTRQAHLNTWLMEHGYLALQAGVQRADVMWLKGIDWSRTRAYAIGLNALYLNVAGRERLGVVPPAERAALAASIAQELAQWTDGEHGPRVVSAPRVREEIYHGPHVEAAPDVIVGYARGYRASWDTTTGKLGATLLEDNLDEWSGDHCMDPAAVPGVLIANRKLGARPAELRDLPVTLLRYFGVTPPAQMQGHDVF